MVAGPAGRIAQPVTLFIACKLRAIQFGKVSGDGSSRLEVDGIVSSRWVVDVKICHESIRVAGGCMTELVQCRKRTGRESKGSNLNI